MTTAEAIREASKKVRVHHYGPNQWKVMHWSARHNAWWDGDITNRPTAMMAAFENRIKIALELLGNDADDASTSAYMYLNNSYPCDWRQCVRDEVKADALARSQVAA
jgi:hypothetical protein